MLFVRTALEYALLVCLVGETFQPGVTERERGGGRYDALIRPSLRLSLHLSIDLF